MLTGDTLSTVISSDFLKTLGQQVSEQMVSKSPWGPASLQGVLATSRRTHKATSWRVLIKRRIKVWE